MENRAARLSLIALIVIAAMSLAACGDVAEKAAEKAAEKSTGTDVEVDGDDVTVTSKDGKSVTASSKDELPDDFPDDVLVYEGEIVNSTSSEGMFTVSVETPDAQADVYAWHESRLTDEGWAKKSAIALQGGGGMLAATKADRVVQYTIGEGSGGGASIVIYTGPAQ